MNISTLEKVYFIGIGGIGMSALARFFNVIGKKVGGYDKTPTSLTDALVAEGMDIHFDDSIELISSHFKNKEKSLVVYTPAIPAGHTEFNYFKDEGFELMKRSEVLGFITNQKTGIGIAGTHGKTTTSTMVAHLLNQSAVGCNAFLGGISKNYGTNLLLNADSEYVVAEADEFDRSFLRLNPLIEVITSVDADHLDIYDNHDNIKQAFTDYTNKIKDGGTLIVRAGLDFQRGTDQNYTCYTYSPKAENADFRAINLKIVDGLYHFDVQVPSGHVIKHLVLGVPGFVNVENSVAAIAVAHCCGASDDEIRKALASFSGVKRRFDYQLKTDKVVFIDDYAHHPKEIEAFVSSVRSIYPNKKLLGVFQPHLFTRTRDFAEGFAESLSLLDEVILLDIYPARELPIEGVTSEIIFKDITSPQKIKCAKEDLLKVLKTKEFDVLMTIGAGDIDKELEGIRDWLLRM